MPYGRRSKYSYKRLLKGRRGYKRVCARGSIRTRTVRSRRHGRVLVRVCCPRGWWSRRRQRCRRGMRGIEVLKPKSRVLRLAQRVKRRLAANPRRSRNDNERRLWVLNDEGLYNWWRGNRQPIQEFIRENRAELDRLIDAVLDRKPGRNPRRRRR